MNKNAIPLSVRRHQHVAAVRTLLKDRDVLVGVSGGADSVALLLLCCAAASQQSASFDVVAAHIHHGLRTESDDEAIMVEQLCTQLSIKCVTKRIQVEPINGSLAAGARAQRYNALVDIATKLKFKAVAVAHHAGDQLETMLMALCRGGGLRKLAGMTSSRSLHEDIVLLRPLLHVEKKTLEDICRESRVSWCEDPTNHDTDTPRGRLRRDVVPVLRELWSAADRHAANASVMLQAAADSFDDLLPGGTRWSRESLSQYSIPVIAATVHRVVGDNATFEIVQSIATAVVDDNTEPRSFPCGAGCTATVTAHHVEIAYS